MKCPKCVELGMKSTVQSNGCSTTLLDYSPGYYDQDGNWVGFKDPNTTTCYYTCSNGHKFYTKSREGEETKYGIIE